MVAAILLLTCVTLLEDEHIEATAEEKAEFLRLLATLPTRGESFTKEAIETAKPHTRVLLSLTEKDLGKRALYPFLLLSAGLLEHEEQQKYGVKHFASIAHPELKLAWGAMLFDKEVASPQIVKFLRAAINSRDQKKAVMRDLLGPNFDDFRKRLKEYEFDEDNKQPK